MVGSPVDRGTCTGGSYYACCLCHLLWMKVGTESTTNHQQRPLVTPPKHASHAGSNSWDQWVGSSSARRVHRCNVSSQEACHNGCMGYQPRQRSATWHVQAGCSSIDRTPYVCTHRHHIRAGTGLVQKAKHVQICTQHFRARDSSCRMQALVVILASAQLPFIHF